MIACALRVLLSSSDCSDMMMLPFPSSSCAAVRSRQQAVVCKAQTTAVRCPFAPGGRFAIAPPNPEKKFKPSPLDTLLQPFAAPANVFLANGSPGQNVPGRLVAGINRLYEAGHFLLEDPDRLDSELDLKEQALASRKDEVLVAEPCSLPAQQELLDLLLLHLRGHYPDIYQVQGEGSARRVVIQPPRGRRREYAVADFAAAPLELCARMVVEDLVLVRAADEPGPDPKGVHHVMTAACVVFSFGELQDKLGQPMMHLHAPVPGYEAALEKVLNRTFTAMQADKPVWRNNWGIALNGDISQPIYSTDASGGRSQGLAAVADSARPPVDSLWLKTEYETLRRLPDSRAILFTIKTLTQPLNTIGVEAAATFASSLAGMTPEMRAYKGLEGEAAEEVLEYLNVLAAAKAPVYAR